jgi:hypothetical protein
MRTRSHLIATSVVVALSGAAFAGPAAALTFQDYRSPDAADAASAHEPGSPGQDQRSPDAADAATPTPSQPYVPVTPPPAVRQPSAGFDWDSAAIGAGGTIGLLAVSAGTGLALRRRHSTATSRLAAH